MTKREPIFNIGEKCSGPVFNRHFSKKQTIAETFFIAKSSKKVAAILYSPFSLETNGVIEAPGALESGTNRLLSHRYGFETMQFHFLENVLFSVSNFL